MEIFCGIVNGAAESTTMEDADISVLRLSTLTFAIFIAALKEIIYRAVLHASILNDHRKLIAEAEPRKCCFYKSNIDQHGGRAVVFTPRNQSRDPLDELVSMVSKFSCASCVAMDSLFITMADVSAEELD